VNKGENPASRTLCHSVGEVLYFLNQVHH
jgi:hypothetical protein